MGLVIEDGEGKGFKAGIDSLHRLKVTGAVVGPLEFESGRGNAATFTSTFVTGGSDVEVISIQNTDAKHFHISRIFLASSVITVWDLFEVKSGTPAGTVLNFVNPNIDSGKVNTATSFGNNAVTGSVAGDTIILTQTLADVGIEIFVEGMIILGTNDTFAIAADANGTVRVSVVGFWEG